MRRKEKQRCYYSRALLMATITIQTIAPMYIETPKSCQYVTFLAIRNLKPYIFITFSQKATFTTIASDLPFITLVQTVGDVLHH